MAMTLRLTPDQADAVRRVAEREHRSMHAVVVAAVESYVEQRALERDEMLRAIVADNAAVLQRLADA